MNAVCKCHACHRWWHENPLEGAAWFLKKYGEGVEAILLEKKRNGVRVTKTEETEIGKHYKAEVEKIELQRNAGVQGYIDFTSYQ
jgi:hypothetical protein